MKKRVDSLNRVQSVQKMLSELAEWRLTQMQTELTALESSRKDVLQALSDNQLFLGPSAAFMTTQIRGLQLKIDEASKNQTAQAELTRRHKTNVNLADRLLRDAKLQYRCHTEKQGLADIIEHAAMAPQSSLTQDSMAKVSLPRRLERKKNGD